MTFRTRIIEAHTPAVWCARGTYTGVARSTLLTLLWLDGLMLGHHALLLSFTHHPTVALGKAVS